MSARPSLAVAAALAAGAAAGCGSAPATPTWQGDVAPILASNCIRCHGSPALGGAPPTFRLDTYDDTYDPATGRVVAGAGTMSLYMAERARDGSMPPRFPLVGHAADVLANWASLYASGTATIPAQRPPRGPARSGNHAPTIAVTAGAADGELSYQIDDADFEPVYGTLVLDELPAARATVAYDLHAGRGTVAIDTSLLAPGDHPMHAVLDDGGGPVTIALAPLHVARTGDAPPHVEVIAPADADILADPDAPSTIRFVADDLDAGDTLTASIRAIDLVHPNAAPVAVTTGLAVTAGAETTFAWDTTAVAAGPDWALEIAVGDGTLTTTVRSRPFVISHGTTTEDFHAIECDILLPKCGFCHNDLEEVIPGLHDQWNVFHVDPANQPADCDPSLPYDRRCLAGVHDRRGLIYLRAIVRQDMPPVSSKVLSGGGDAAVLSDDDRRRLGEWLLAGAPGAEATCP